MIVLVTGGRAYQGKQRLFAVLDALHRERGITLLIQGGATGADALANHWALSRGIRSITYKADWAKHGKGAGHIRNRQMLEKEKPELVVAFPGGAGTANMCELARRAGVELIVDRGPQLDETEHALGHGAK